MGKVEKVIVLSVLFVIALILVVSLTLDDPLKKNKVVDATAPAAKPILAENKAPAALDTPAAAGHSEVFAANNVGAAKSDPLLSLAVGTKAPTVAVPPAPSAQGPTHQASHWVTKPPPIPGTILLTTDGLEDSILRDMKLYRWKENDSYRLLADRYYGDWQKFYILRRSNEGRTDVKPGETIFVPSIDKDDTTPAVAAVPEGTVVKPPVTGGDAHKIAKDAKAKAGDHGKSQPKSIDGGDAKHATDVAKLASGKKIHVVKDGDTLWKIAKEELGNGSRWEEIYKLNSEKLKSEKTPLKKGWELAIP